MLPKSTAYLIFLREGTTVSALYDLPPGVLLQLCVLTMFKIRNITRFTSRFCANCKPSGIQSLAIFSVTMESPLCNFDTVLVKIMKVNHGPQHRHKAKIEDQTGCSRHAVSRHAVFTTISDYVSTCLSLFQVKDLEAKPLREGIIVLMLKDPQQRRRRSPLKKVVIYSAVSLI